MKITIHAIIAAAIALAGCRTTTPEQRTQERIDRIHATVEGRVLREQQWRPRLDDMALKLEAIHEKDVRTTQRMPDQLYRRGQDEYWRWRNNEPVYQQHLESAARGDPERAIRTAERVFY